MSLYERVVPTPYDYFEKLESLDELDLDIILEMIKGGPNATRNVKKIAEKLNKPQQTVNYRVNRFDIQDLVRFRATVDEEAIGLSNFIVMVDCDVGSLYENKRSTAVNASTFLTCYPVWRFGAGIDGGSMHGVFLVYTIPQGKRKDLELFLLELEEKNFIVGVKEIHPATRQFFNLSDVRFYNQALRAAQQRGKALFNWEDWARTFGEATESRILDRPREETKVPSLEYNDLLVLYHLEQNLRKSFIDMGKAIGESSVTISKRYSKLLQYGAIVGGRAEIYPSDPSTALYPLLKLEMTQGSALRKFISILNRIPYKVVFQKAKGKNTIFLRTMIPSYEFFDFNNAFETLNNLYRVIASKELYLGSHYTRADNIALYLPFSKEKNTWMFSSDIMSRELQQLIESARAV